MAIFDKFFNPSGLLSKTEKLKDLRTSQQRQLGTSFLSSLQRGVSDFTPGEAFQGSLDVGLSNEEQLGLNKLNKFAGIDLSGNEAFQAGRKNILGTLAGSFDPRTSDSFKSVRAEIEREKQKAIAGARRGASVRGDFRSTGSQRVEGDILTDTTNKVNTILAQLASKERDRQVQAANQALTIGQFEQEEPLRQAKALTSIGSLSRLVEESNLARTLEDFQRQRREGQTALIQAGQAANQGQPLLGTDKVVTPTFLGELLKATGSALGGSLGTTLGGKI